jgi:hypothetical protein
MRVVTAAEDAAARGRQIQVNGREYTLKAYVGNAPTRGHYEAGNEVNDNGLPQAFLVEQPSNAVTPAHFHEPNQFQVFVDGVGRIGAHPTAPLTVQYANGHTPYGPIVAGEEGVRYFTLRQSWDPGAKYLPASRDLLKKGNQRTRIKGDIAIDSDAARAARTSATSEVVFEQEADGLAAWVWRVPPRERVTLPSADAGGGQYLLVVGGSLVADGADLSRLSTVYITADEPAYEVVAGAGGLDLLVMQFPRRGETASGGASRTH